MNSLFDVSGKVAVVTGGSGVLGSNISEGLLKAGAKVAVIGAHSDRVEKALERLRTTGGEVCGFTCNVLDMDSLREVKEKVLAQWGRVDILVNAAGGNIPGGTLTETQHVFDMKVEDLNKVVDLNLKVRYILAWCSGKLWPHRKAVALSMCLPWHLMKPLPVYRAIPWPRVQ